MLFRSDLKMTTVKDLMKEQGKNPPDLTNEEEIGSLPEEELSTSSAKKTSR